MILPIQRCEDNWTRNILYYASDVLVDIWNTTVMLRCSNDMVSSKDWVRRSQEIPRNNSKIISERKVQPNKNQVRVGRKSRTLSMITQSLRGEDGISHHEFDWYPETCQYIDGYYDRFCRGAMKRPSNGDDIKQKERWSERLLEPRLQHKLEIKLDDQGEMIWWGRST